MTVSTVCHYHADAAEGTSYSDARRLSRCKREPPDVMKSAPIPRRRSSSGSDCVTCGACFVTCARRADDAAAAAADDDDDDADAVQPGWRRQFVDDDRQGPWRRRRLGAVTQDAAAPLPRPRCVLVLGVSATPTRSPVQSPRAHRCLRAPRPRQSASRISVEDRWLTRDTPSTTTATSRCCHRARCPRTVSSTDWPQPRPVLPRRMVLPAPPSRTRSAGTTGCWSAGCPTCSGTRRWSCPGRRHAAGQPTPSPPGVPPAEMTDCAGWFQIRSASTCPGWTEARSVSLRPGWRSALLMSTRTHCLLLATDTNPLVYVYARDWQNNYNGC